jgi:uncharacterized membrane protein
MKKNKYLTKLQVNHHKSALHKRVAQSINDDNLLTQDLQDEPTDTFGERIADKVAEFGGSWRFIGIFAAVLIVWITFNSIAFFFKPFDPYPYILLNLVLSCIAAIQAPVIMMSQNRKEAHDRRRAENDYMVNLKAEIEIRNLHEKLDALMEEQTHKISEIHQKQMEMLEMLLQNHQKA